MTSDRTASEGRAPGVAFVDPRAVLVLTGCLCLTATGGAAGTRSAVSLEALRAEFRTVDRQVYEALERAPVRGWGQLGDEMWRPLYAVRNALRAPGADAEKLARTAPRRLAAVYEAYLKKLCLEAAGTLSVAVDGSARLQPGEVKLTTHAGVPTALVLRLAAAKVGGMLSVAPVRAGPVRLDGQELRLTRHFGQYVVLPILATGRPDGPLTLKITAAGKTTGVPFAVEVKPGGTLKGTVVRKSKGAPLAAKLFVEDDAGRLYVVPGEANYRTQSWYAPWQPRFSYVQKSFALPLPPGRYRITAMKGYAWLDATASVEIRPNKTAEAHIEMTPLRDLESDGWLCGDMHIHSRGRLPLAQLRAEDVHVAANTLYSSKRSINLPFYADRSDATHLNCANQEIEHWIFGNTFYFNVPTTVLDPATPRPQMTPMFHYDKQAHRMGGITFRWLRARPFSPEWHGQQQPELAVSAALGHMDVWSVLENSMQNLLDSPRRKWTGRGWGGRLYEQTYETWYALLNCGLRVPIAAGTSYGRLSRLGFNRVYAKVRGKLSLQSWADAVKRGDGFVTNGPLLWLRAGGKLPGDGLALKQAGEVKLTVELASRHPVRLIEILCNGKVVATKEVRDAAAGLKWDFTASVEEPCWFAARCFGEHTPRYPHMAAHNQFAHTNALFVTLAGKRPTSPKDAARFVREIDALIAFAPHLPTDALRTRALAAYQKARRYFADMARE